MTRTLEIRRHADNDGDVLTSEGVEASLRVGREHLAGGYAVVVSSGAQRATQTAACLLAGLGEQVTRGVVVVTGFRSDREDEWRAAYGTAGSGHLDAFRRVAPALVEEDGAVLSEALREVVAMLADGERALVLGHTPTSEAAVLGLTGEAIDPLGKLEGVVVEVDGDEARITDRLR